MALSLTRRSARLLARADAPGRGLVLFGVPVRLEASCVFALGLTTWTLADAILPLAADGRPAVAYWAAGALTALALLASLAAHELAHCLAARRAGIAVRHVRLALFGGSTVLEDTPRTTRARLSIALAGPLGSLGVAAAATVVHVALVESGVDALGIATTAVVAVTNLGVAAINLLPAPPLDGGLALEALLARLPRIDAAAAAAVMGRALGGVVLAVAVMAAVSGDTALALWGALLGLVMWEHAGSSPPEGSA